MKTNSLILLALVVIGVLFATLAPAAMKDKLIGLTTFATNERRCFNFHKDDFNDPDSAYIDHSFISQKDNRSHAFLSREYKEMLQVKVRVKNQMGAYDWDYVSCPLVEGKFDETASRLYKHVLDDYKENGKIPLEAFKNGDVEEIAPTQYPDSVPD